MRWDMKALLVGLALLGVGGIALSVAQIWRISPDAAPTITEKVLQFLALVGLAAIFSGSLTIAGASISFCGRLAPGKLVTAALTFLVVAAVVWGIGREFPPDTYSWVPILIPWCVAIFSGASMLFAAIVRAIVATRVPKSSGTQFD